MGAYNADSKYCSEPLHLSLDPLIPFLRRCLQPRLGRCLSVKQQLMDRVCVLLQDYDTLYIRNPLSVLNSPTILKPKRFPTVGSYKP